SDPVTGLSGVQGGHHHVEAHPRILPPVTWAVAVLGYLTQLRGHARPVKAHSEHPVLPPTAPVSWLAILPMSGCERRRRVATSGDAEAQAGDQPPAGSS